MNKLTWDLQLQLAVCFIETPTHQDNTDLRSVLETFQGFLSILRRDVMTSQLLHEGNQEFDIYIIVIDQENSGGDFFWGRRLMAILL